MFPELTSVPFSQKQILDSSDIFVSYSLSAVQLYTQLFLLATPGSLSNQLLICIPPTCLLASPGSLKAVDLLVWHLPAGHPWIYISCWSTWIPRACWQPLDLYKLLICVPPICLLAIPGSISAVDLHESHVPAGNPWISTSWWSACLPPACWPPLDLNISCWPACLPSACWPPLDLYQLLICMPPTCLLASPGSLSAVDLHASHLPSGHPWITISCWSACPPLSCSSCWILIFSLLSI